MSNLLVTLPSVPNTCTGPQRQIRGLWHSLTDSSQCYSLGISELGKEATPPLQLSFTSALRSTQDKEHYIKISLLLCLFLHLNFIPPII